MGGREGESLDLWGREQMVAAEDERGECANLEKKERERVQIYGREEGWWQQNMTEEKVQTKKREGVRGCIEPLDQCLTMASWI